MRLLVTGGAGFIGSNFVRHVLQTTDDVHVTNLDALTYAGNLASLHDVADDPRHRFVHGDVCDAGLVDALTGQADAVVHFAAETHVDRSIDGPEVFLRTNVVGAGVVFDAARRHGLERVLHVSTDEVYGSIEVGAFTEGDPLAPNSPYAVSKASADLLARAYAVTYDFPITVTRTSNNFGPYQYPEKLIPLFVTNLLDGRRVPLYGDGRNVRDWTHVADNAAALWLVLTRGRRGEVYNVGAGNELSNRELTRRVLAHLDAGEDRIEHVPDRPGHDLRYAIDSSRVRALGWRPARSFDEALAETIHWYRHNEAWWRPLKQAGASRRRGHG
ncbi:dTDP-glucose 4,6-dehydratase [Egicoccus sp. AB-alg2]|uniref:dTDP-glucose 4,6-dehydratase n=1 Tax=Egicoccus sp. AB-alg2 TaxID=3242693 RepID=UPI00359D29E3